MSRPERRSGKIFPRRIAEFFLKVENLKLLSSDDSVRSAQDLRTRVLVLTSPAMSDVVEYVLGFLVERHVPSSGSLIDRPCAARQVPNRSIVCVCNATYCDEIIRDVPRSGRYRTYTTSAAGLRFKKGDGHFSSAGCSSRGGGAYAINLDVSKKYQKIKGFGGSVTDSASINWRSLPEAAQQHLINSYFSETGLEYNIVRVPIGCSDFSVRHYTYDDFPEDVDLVAFSLQPEDYFYKIPMLKSIYQVATAPVLVIGSYWTCPAWMKYTTETNSHCGFLKREYYQTFANYLYKFIEKYEEEGIPIWAITTGNEPSLAHMTSVHISCLGWDNHNQGNWIVNNLGPTIRNSVKNKTKIFALDDQLFYVKHGFGDMVRNNSKVLDFVDAIAVHYYTDSFISPEVLRHVTETYPKLFVISTEACEGFHPDNPGMDLGSWKFAKKYIHDIIQDLLHDQVGWIDWNLCLDTKGGPNVDFNFVDSPVIVDESNQEFLKQPMFYALGHVTKFIPRDSVRIGTWSPPCSCSISHVAVLTPKNTIVVVIHNEGEATSVTLRQGNREATLNIEADSIVTVEFLNE